MRLSDFRPVLAQELRRTARDPLTLAGLFAMTMVLLIGAWLHWRALPPRPQNGRLFGEAFLLAAIIAWHAGIARDRMARFDMYLVANFSDVASVYFAKVSAALLAIGTLSVIAFAIATATSAGNIEYAAHYAGLFLLASIVALPAVVLVELAFNTRYPMPVLLLLFMAALAVYGRLGDVRALLRLLGMDGAIETGPAVLRTLTALALTAACYPLFRLRLGARRLARAVDSP